MGQILSAFYEDAERRANPLLNWVDPDDVGEAFTQEYFTQEYLQSIAAKIAQAANEKTTLQDFITTVLGTVTETTREIL